MEEVKNDPFAQGSQPLPETQDLTAQTGEPQSQMLADGSLPEVEVPPMISPLELLDGLLLELEGAAHLSKSEILAIIDKYRVLRGE